MRRIFLAVAISASFAGCGGWSASSSTGTACSSLGADWKGITPYFKQKLAHGVLSPSEQQALANLQHEAREAYAACEREGRVITPPRRPPP